jgi:hypothetical protein
MKTYMVRFGVQVVVCADTPADAMDAFQNNHNLATLNLYRVDTPTVTELTTADGFGPAVPIVAATGRPSHQTLNEIFAPRQLEFEFMDE